MAGAQVRRLLRVIINGIGLMREIDEYTSANPKKQTADVGGFIKGKQMVGIEAMQGTVKGKGIRAYVKKVYGLSEDTPVTVTIRESIEDEDGIKTASEETWIGKVATIERGAGSAGAQLEDTLTFDVDTSTRITDGITEWNVNRKANICDLGNGDLLATDRQNVGMF